MICCFVQIEDKVSSCIFYLFQNFSFCVSFLNNRPACALFHLKRVQQKWKARYSTSRNLTWVTFPPILKIITLSFIRDFRNFTQGYCGVLPPEDIHPLYRCIPGDPWWWWWPVSKAWTPPPGFGRPPDLTQIGGARSLWPKLRYFPRWWRGHPGQRPRQPPRIQYGVGLFRPLAQLAPSLIVCLFFLWDLQQLTHT